MRLIDTPSPVLRQGVARLQRHLAKRDLPRRRGGNDIVRDAEALFGLDGSARGPAQRRYPTADTARNYLDTYAKILESSSHWDSPLDLMDLQDTWSDLARASAWMERFGEHPVYLCTARVEVMNARTYLLEGDPTPVVMFYDTAFDHLADLAWVFANAYCAALGPIASTREKPLTPRPALDSGASSAFDAAADAFLLRHVRKRANTPHVRDWDPDNPVATPALAIYDCLKCFLIGHELGHIAHDHFSDRKLWSIAAVEDGEEAFTVEEVMRNWRQELQADLHGYEVALFTGHENGYHPQYAAWAAMLFFCSLEWIAADRPERLAAAQSGDLSAFSTHPPAAMRRQHIERAVNALSNPDPSALLHYEFSAIAALDAAMKARLLALDAGAGDSQT